MQEQIATLYGVSVYLRYLDDQAKKEAEGLLGRDMVIFYAISSTVDQLSNLVITQNQLPEAVYALMLHSGEIHLSYHELNEEEVRNLLLEREQVKTMQGELVTGLLNIHNDPSLRAIFDSLGEHICSDCHIADECDLEPAKVYRQKITNGRGSEETLH